jgi:uncharacterized membrane protein (TIGR02234 family)
VTARRELRIAVGLTLLGALVMLVALSRVWVTFAFPSGLSVEDLTKTSTGREIVPAARALAFVGLAGVLAVAATRTWGRTVVGVVLMLSGVATVLVVGSALHTGLATSALGTERIAQACGTQLSAAACLKGFQDLGGFRVHTHAGWAYLTLGGGVALAGAGALLAVRGRRWAALSSSYEVAGPALPPVTDKGVWDALDRGDDPTA